MVLFWVDNCVCYAKDGTSINSIISSLKDDFLLEREEGMEWLLSLWVKRNEGKGILTLTQTGLTSKILIASQIEDCNVKFTPTGKVPMSKDLDGDPLCKDWDCKSMAGINFRLTGSTLPGIARSARKYARFSHLTKYPREIGIKHIVRWLKRARYKSLIMAPIVGSLQLYLHAGADFASIFAS